MPTSLGDAMRIGARPLPPSLIVPAGRPAPGPLPAVHTWRRRLRLHRVALAVMLGTAACGEHAGATDDGSAPVHDRPGEPGMVTDAPVPSWPAALNCRVPSLATVAGLAVTVIAATTPGAPATGSVGPPSSHARDRSVANGTMRASRAMSRGTIGYLLNPRDHGRSPNTGRQSKRSSSRTVMVSRNSERPNPSLGWKPS